MNEEQFRHLLELADKRDEKRYAWLRHLLLLASGALTLLVALRAGTPLGPWPLWSLRVAWIALGFGILLLAVALHGDIWTAVALVKKAAAELTSRPLQPGLSVATRPALYERAEQAAYVCLTTTVLALVIHGVSR